MKCLNPACGSVRADEINVSVNVSETMDSEELEYTGTTNYGDVGEGIGTMCHDCQLMTFRHDYLKIIEDELTVSDAQIERGWAAVLPKPTIVHVVAWYSESGGEASSGGFEWRDNEGLATSLYVEMVREDADYLTGKHVTVLSRVEVPAHLRGDTEKPAVSEYLNGITDALEDRVADESVTVIAVSINERKES